MIWIVCMISNESINKCKVLDQRIRCVENCINTFKFNKSANRMSWFMHFHSVYKTLNNLIRCIFRWDFWLCKKSLYKASLFSFYFLLSSLTSRSFSLLFICLFRLFKIRRRLSLVSYWYHAFTKYGVFLCLSSSFTRTWWSR